MGSERNRQQHRKNKLQYDKCDAEVAKQLVSGTSLESPTAVTSDVAVLTHVSVPKQPKSKPMSIEETIHAVKAGRHDLRPQLRRLLLQEDPAVWKNIADITRFTIDQWALKISIGNPLIREAIILAATEERNILTPAGASPIEKVLADRLVLAKLQLNFFELQNAANGADPDVIGTRLGDALAGRVKSANHELLKATRHYQKAIDLKAELAATRPDASVVALKIHNPDAKNCDRKCA